MSKRCVHCGCLVSVAVAYFIALSAAAPVLRDNSAAEKPLVRTKRADEIIFNGQTEIAGTKLKKSELPAATLPKNEKSESELGNVKTVTVKGGPEVSQNETESDDEAENGKNSVNESSDDDERAASSQVDYNGSDRRRRTVPDVTVVSAAGSRNNIKREERSVVQPVAAMVAENMVAGPAAGGQAGRQRTKRELDADTIRELIESSEPVPQEEAIDYNDYGTEAGREYLAEPNPEEITVDEVGRLRGELEEEEPFDVELTEGDYFTDDDRRPKRRMNLEDYENEMENDKEEEEEEEEAYEEAELEVVRELLAERAAEETRQALLAFLTKNDDDKPRFERPTRRSDDRFAREDIGSEDTAYAGEDGDEEEEEMIDDDGESDEGFERSMAGERLVDDSLDENDDRLDGEQFLANDVPEAIDEAAADEQKRFLYPYNDEAYGSRWSALVPGSKRSDRDPYDRLYRLAEALSRPTAIGSDEYKK